MRELAFHSDATVTPAEWFTVIVVVVGVIFNYGVYVATIGFLARRIKEHDQRLERHEEKLESHGEEISALQERTQRKFVR